MFYTFICLELTIYNKNLQFEGKYDYTIIPAFTALLYVKFWRYALYLTIIWNPIFHDGIRKENSLLYDHYNNDVWAHSGLANAIFKLTKWKPQFALKSIFLTLSASGNSVEGPEKMLIANNCSRAFRMYRPKFTISFCHNFIGKMVVIQFWLVEQAFLHNPRLQDYVNKKNTIHIEWSLKYPLCN